VQWLHTHSLYGPAFTLVSAAVARTWAGSPGATIFVFKLLSGVAVAIATCFAALTASRTRPERAPLAAALVGLDPVLVLHTVGGGHVDALIAAPLAVAAAMAVRRPRGNSARAICVTVLLTTACLVKVAIAPALALWVLWLVRNGGARRARLLGAHVGVVVASIAASMLPFLAGWHTLAPFETLGGVEAWASPSQLVGRTARTIVSSLAGPGAGANAARIVEAGFLVFFLVLLWRLARLIGASDTASPVDGWAMALLLCPLSMPFLLPWYSAWFAPLLGTLSDELVLAAGGLVTAVLALTLIPADPFHGYSTQGVMDGVHYGAASVLLIILSVVARRVLRLRRIAAATEEHGM
jgi:hypothetical protein